MPGEVNICTQFYWIPFMCWVLPLDVGIMENRVFKTMHCKMEQRRLFSINISSLSFPLRHENQIRSKLWNWNCKDTNDPTQALSLFSFKLIFLPIIWKYIYNSTIFREKPFAWGNILLVSSLPSAQANIWAIKCRTISCQAGAILGRIRDEIE